MPADSPAIPLARRADRQLRLLAVETGSARIAGRDWNAIARAVLRRDCGVAGGLSRALAQTSGAIGYDGDAQRLGLAMSAIDAELRAWGASRGQPFRRLERRTMFAPMRWLGADAARYLPC